MDSRGEGSLAAVSDRTRLNRCQWKADRSMVPSSIKVAGADLGFENLESQKAI